MSWGRPRLSPQASMRCWPPLHGGTTLKYSCPLTDKEIGLRQEGKGQLEGLSLWQSWDSPCLSPGILLGGGQAAPQLLSKDLCSPLLSTPAAHGGTCVRFPEERVHLLSREDPDTWVPDARGRGPSLHHDPSVGSVKC